MTEKLVSRTGHNHVYASKNGKKWTTPKCVPFENSIYKLCFYKIIDFRPPQKGEFYLSGAIPEAYKAPNDLRSNYLVVVPTYEARAITDYLKADKINIDDKEQWY